LDPNTVPHPGVVRLNSLALSSTEAFVVGQIDGTATLGDVADATGLPVEQVITIALRLEELGAIERPKPGSRGGVSGRYADVPRSSSPSVSRTKAARKMTPVPGAKPGKPSQAKLRAARPSGEHAATKAKPTARPSKTMRATRPTAPERPATRAPGRTASKGHHVAVPRHAARRETNPPVAAPSIKLGPPAAWPVAPPAAKSAPPVVAPVAPPAAKSAPPISPAPAKSPPPSDRTPATPILASPRPAPPPVITNVEPPPTSARAPRTSVQRLIESAKSATFLHDAQRALLDGDIASAANQFRLALQFADDPRARATAEHGLAEARSMLADTYLKRAVGEEKESRWSEAVLSYEKALDRRPDDPAIGERLANALRQDGQDLPRATRLAELAVSRAPRSASYKRTLGLIYADTGARDKAIEQFEGALKIDPSDDVADRALAVLRKGRR
jgi:Tfp pilus assembly protein PilF